MLPRRPKATPPDARAEGIVNYLAVLQALARHHGMSGESLVEWVQRPYVEAGYYETQGGPDAETLKRAVDTFVRGRSLLYAHSDVEQLDDGYEVRTPVWYLDSPPEAFFFFDVDPRTFAQYAADLAKQHAKRQGVNLQIDLVDGVERARFVLGSASARLRVRESDPADHRWLVTEIERDWGSVNMVLAGCGVNLLDCPTLVAITDDLPQGYLVYRVDSRCCEILAIKSRVPESGAGSALVAALRMSVTGKTIRAVTTNDNLPALRFFQRRGFRLTELRPGAVDSSRAVKPQIPIVGATGLPIHDELVFEMQAD